MKKITLLLLMLISGTVFGQTEVTDAKATAEIITALKLVKETDMHLGKIAPLSDATSTFILKTDGTADASSTATDMDNTGRMAATFTITGEQGETFGLTIPSTVSLSGGTGPAMTLTLDPDLGVSGNGFTLGSATLNIGGSLALASNQGSGTYSGTFTVKVNYE